MSSNRDIAQALHRLAERQVETNEILTQLASYINMLLTRADTGEIFANTVLAERLGQISSSLDILATRATAAENRQCHAFGEGTDGARFLEQFAIGEDACLTKATAESAVARLCEGMTSSQFSYLKIFEGKDKRRAEWFVECFFKIFEDGEEISYEADDENVGSRSLYLRSTRQYLIERHAVMRHEQRGAVRNVSEEQFEELLPRIDQGRAILTSLMMPIDKQFMPVEESDLDKAARLKIRFYDEIGQAFVNKEYENFAAMFEDLPEHTKKFIREAVRAGCLLSSVLRFIITSFRGNF